MANKQKRGKKFRVSGGRHACKRKVLGYGRKAYNYSSHLKDANSCVLVINRKRTDRKKSVKKVKRRALKKFYQLYRSPETGQLRKRFVKRLFLGKANGYRWVHTNTGNCHEKCFLAIELCLKTGMDRNITGTDPIFFGF